MTDDTMERRRYDNSIQAQITKWVVRAVGAGAIAAIGWLFHTVLDLTAVVTGMLQPAEARQIIKQMLDP